MAPSQSKVCCCSCSRNRFFIKDLLPPAIQTFRSLSLYSFWHFMKSHPWQTARASQKSEVKKRSQSCKMKGIEKHFHSGETHDGLYDTASRKPRRPRAACQGDAIALRGVPTGGGWAKGTWEAL